MDMVRAQDSPELVSFPYGDDDDRARPMSKQVVQKLSDERDWWKGVIDAYPRYGELQGVDS